MDSIDCIFIEGFQRNSEEKEEINIFNRGYLNRPVKDTQKKFEFEKGRCVFKVKDIAFTNHGVNRLSKEQSE